MAADLTSDLEMLLPYPTLTISHIMHSLHSTDFFVPESDLPSCDILGEEECPQGGLNLSLNHQQQRTLFGRQRYVLGPLLEQHLGAWPEQHATFKMNLCFGHTTGSL